MDPDMVLDSSLGQAVTMAPGGSAGHSDQHGPWQCGPQTPTWPQGAAQTNGLCKALSGDRSHLRPPQYQDLDINPWQTAHSCRPIPQHPLLGFRHYAGP